MKTTLALAALAVLATLPAAAQMAEPVDPADFHDYAQGFTLYFEEDGEPVGSESFGPDGAVTWRTPEGECFEGLWREHEGLMCFFYSGEADVTCWQVLRDEDGMMVRRESGDPPEVTFRVVGRDRKPLLCGAPGVKT